MKILLATSYFPPSRMGGAPYSAMNLARALRLVGNEVEVLTLGEENSSRCIHEIPVTQVRGPNVYWNIAEKHGYLEKMAWHTLENYNPRAYEMMKRALANVQPDVLLTYDIKNVNVASWRAARRAGRPVCHVACDFFMMCWRSVMAREGRDCGTQCESCRLVTTGRRLGSRWVDGFVGVSEFVTRRHLAAGYFPTAKVGTVAPSIEAVRAHMPRRIEPGRPIRIGYLGAHNNVKGLETLAAAAHRLARDGEWARRSVDLRIAGWGEEAFSRHLMTLYPGEITTFTGWVDANEFLSDLDLLVVPSSGNEANARVAVEAYAHAVPVIGSTSGGIPEAIVPGVTGDLFTAGDDAALAEKLRGVIERPETLERWSAGALEAAHGFLLSSVGERMTLFLSEMVEERRVREGA